MELIDLPIEDLNDLRQAKRRLEYPSLTSQISNLIGRPIEKMIKMLPKGWDQQIDHATTSALLKCLEVAQTTFGEAENQPGYHSKDNWHKLAVFFTGGIGGAFGIPATIVELPVTTTIILRSIADIAKSEGHDLTKLEIQLSCIEVFALGGKNESDDASETGYWFTRAALATRVTESTPQILRLVSKIAARFSVQVSEEIAAKIVPVVGIVSGSTINVLFINHFQNVAKGHFVIKRLENKYGSEIIQKLYSECPV